MPHGKDIAKEEKKPNNFVKELPFVSLSPIKSPIYCGEKFWRHFTQLIYVTQSELRQPNREDDCFKKRKRQQLAASRPSI